MGVCDRVDDREAETGALPSPRLVGAAEPLERAIGELVGEPWPLVGHVELDGSPRRARAHGDRAIPVAEGVLEQVSERPLELQAIGLDLGARRNVDLDAPAGRLAAVPANRAADGVRQLRDVDALAPQRQLRVIEARDQQQILCDADQPVGLDGGRLDRGVQLVRRSLAAKRQLELGLEQRERRAQLVTGVGDKATFMREATPRGGSASR